MTSQSTTAPDMMRTSVKLAASMLVSLKAARHNSELLANAIIARTVRKKIRVCKARKNSKPQHSWKAN